MTGSRRPLPVIQAEAVLQSLPEGAIVTDLNTRIRFINRSAAEIFALSPAQAVGRLFADVIKHREINSTIQCFIKEKGDCSRSTPHTLNVTLGGQEQYYKVEVSPMVENEKLVGAVILLTDVTHYERADRLKTQFVATVSHEFRNPLTSITLAVELLLAGGQGTLSSDGQRLLQAIRDDARRLTNLVTNLLNLAKLEDGEIRMELESVGVADMVATAVDPLFMQLCEKSITLSVQIPDNLPDVYVDATKATWILTNLVGNAIRYTPPGGKITVTASLGDNKVYIAVSDSGMGIPPKYHKKIFEKYTQVKGNGNAGGAGLGLAIAKEIVEAHGGSIWVESEVNKGACFKYTLPVSTKEDANG